MSQVATNYDSILYPKTTNNNIILPAVKDNSLMTHISDFAGKSKGGATKKRRYKKGTVIRRNKLARFRKTNRRKKSSRRYK